MKTWHWRLAHGRSLDLGQASVVMGILNVTPDSFADGGQYDRPEKAIDHARRMMGEGAAIIDIGGESTRPGGASISAAEEQARILPVIDALAKDNVILSVDTYRAETARLAVERGVHIINDVWGAQRDPEIAAVAAETGGGLILMHTGRERQKDPDVIADQFSFLRRSLEIARHAGVANDAIVLDPGFGFAKETPEANLELMARFEELHALGYPLAVGTSRKRFVGRVTGKEVHAERAIGTAATSVILRMKGAAIFRVHDVAANRDALKMADAVMASVGNR
ncbi:MAG TPA: dihydropteroate synthase [Rhizobiaceae bacterium]|nr:dihydropteroate synthase [Rhizobiaceae bacterium]